MLHGGNSWADRYQQEEKFSSILEVKMPQHLSDEQRHLIVYLHKKVISKRKIASEVGCSKTGVNVTIKRWKKTENLKKDLEKEERWNQPFDKTGLWSDSPYLIDV